MQRRVGRCTSACFGHGRGIDKGMEMDNCEDSHMLRRLAEASVVFFRTMFVPTATVSWMLSDNWQRGINLLT